MISYESQYYGTVPFLSEYLMHYQVKGAKHGVRRWQNLDGSLTPAGYIHYGVGQGRNKAKTDMRSDNEVSDAEKLVVRTRTSTKPLTKFNPKLTGTEKLENMATVVYEAATAAYSGKSKADVDDQLERAGLSRVNRKAILEQLDAKGNFREMSFENRASKIEESRKKYEKLIGNDYVVGKGLETQRFTTERNEEVGNERKYVSLTDRDKQIYKDFYPKALREWGRQSTFTGISNKLKSPDRVYETKLSTLKDMKVAGAKTYNNAFMELYNDPAIRKQQGWQKTEKGKLYTMIFSKKVAELQAQDIAKARAKFDMGLQLRNRDINKQFLKKLKDRGYDAVEDQFSRKNDGTDGNLIVLDPKSSLKRTSAKEVKFDESGNYAGTTTKRLATKRMQQK